MSILAAMVDLTPTLQDPSSTAARGIKTSRERNFLDILQFNVRTYTLKYL